ncbi:MAG TPA: phosphatidylserine/phosphatidylglycerophosphate/cardiolipin synthase family protein [Bacteroidales bacterium]|nr:phosphatidylserine/phosphatidylglycerophosphate/cardiolipin synthase family protein [Bacteroidales bacterium]
MNTGETYQLFDDPIRYYNAMIDDIEHANDYIYIETYRVGNDTVGVRFRDALLRKVRQGIEVRLLIDAWGGSAVANHFFDSLVLAGAEVRFFEKIKFNTDILTRSHRRNHRKIIVIDDDVTWIGSSNLTGYNLNWRESVLRIRGSLSLPFKKIFKQDWSIYNKYVFVKSNFLRLIRHGQFEIVRDMPSITKQRIMTRYLQLIRKAKQSVVIVTPYFLPGFRLRRELAEAVKRGLDVRVIIPRRSDVGLVDILRNKYLGPMHEAGIKFLLYKPHNLHAKLMLVDSSIFSVGSSNFDYRSFRYMYEIVLIGQDESIANQVQRHIEDTILESELFNIEHWKNRSLINKFFEWLLLPFRHLL